MKRCSGHLARYGETRQAGEIVHAGPFTRPVEVGPGDTIKADYGPLGTVSCFFR
jgi:2-oxo-hept-3-ene-1,7-dioate hydratase